MIGAVKWIRVRCDSVIKLRREQSILAWRGAIKGKVLLERQAEVDKTKWRSLGVGADMRWH